MVKQPHLVLHKQYCISNEARSPQVLWISQPPNDTYYHGCKTHNCYTQYKTRTAIWVAIGYWEGSQSPFWKVFAFFKGSTLKMVQNFYLFSCIPKNQDSLFYKILSWFLFFLAQGTGPWFPPVNIHLTIWEWGRWGVIKGFFYWWHCRVH